MDPPLADALSSNDDILEGLGVEGLLDGFVLTGEFVELDMLVAETMGTRGHELAPLSVSVTVLQQVPVKQFRHEEHQTQS